MSFNKRWILIFVLMFFLILPGVAFAVNKNYKPLINPPDTVQQAKEDNNNFLGFSYFMDQLPSGDKLKILKYPDNGHILIYGDQSGEKKGNESRFLGINRLGEKISNMNFPNDAPPEGMLDDQKWIYSPWEGGENGELFTHLKNKGEKIEENGLFDGAAAFLPNIIQGLKEKLPDEFRDSPKLEWQKIVHILQPPTYYGWGVGRAWHKKADGSIWYRSIPIAPSKIVEMAKNNLQISIAGYKGNPWPGQQITVTAQAVNTSGKTITTDLVWKVNGQVVSTNSVFDVTSTASTSATFIMPSANARVEVFINPNKNRPVDETTWGDNSDSKTINVQEESGKKNSGDIIMDLTSPAQVEPTKAWTYQVRITYNWTQTFTQVLVTPAKDRKPAVYRDEPDDPPVVNLSLDVSGDGKHSEKYDPKLGVNYTSPVSQSDSKAFSLTGGTNKTYTFTFPATALINEGYYVLLKANLSIGATDSAKVYVKPYDVDDLENVLTK